MDAVNLKTKELMDILAEGKSTYSLYNWGSCSIALQFLTLIFGFS